MKPCNLLQRPQTQLYAFWAQKCKVSCSGFKKVGRAGSCNFPTDNSSKSPTEEITGVPKILISPRNFPKRDFLNPNFFIFGRKFSDKIFDRLNLGEG